MHFTLLRLSYKHQTQKIILALRDFSKHFKY